MKYFFQHLSINICLTQKFICLSCHIFFTYNVNEIIHKASLFFTYYMSTAINMFLSVKFRLIEKFLESQLLSLTD